MPQKLQIEEMNRLDVAAFKAAEKLPLIVVLDNVRSVHNVGSIFRTADAFRLAGVWLCGITATPPSVDIHKTALGAEESVDWRYFSTTAEAIAALKADMWWPLWNNATDLLSSLTLNSTVRSVMRL